ncbi:glycosyltransferase family 9 protein [Dyella halodurans]|uniref:Glycosyltransferase family 9 protein n=1 Tax=Dyella halodurans TaxID=1920171 RepID=A0ABV9C2S1_9GAMM|nr:glycosyltransferase family 9 protein [Dyella halodurans]
MNQTQEPIPRKGIYRILVCRPNHRLGNMVLLTPLITELERLYKGVEIDILAEGDIAKEVFSTFFSVKNIYCLPKRGFKRPVRFLRMLLGVRKTQYDLIIDPIVASGFSRALVKFTKGRFKLGYSDTPEKSGLTHSVPLSAAPEHMAKRAVDLLHWGASHAAGAAIDYPTLDIRLTDAERAHGRKVIRDLLAVPQQAMTPLVVGVFANATGAKRYSREWWKEFMDTFRELSPSSNIVEIVPMHGRSMLDSEFPGYFTTDIRRMSAVMAGVDLMVSADCGVMHLAVASRVPTVGMFSVTDATVYEPYGLGSCALVTKGLTARETAQKVVESFSGLLAKGPTGQASHESMPSDRAIEAISGPAGP